jgi:hypothetical protein
VAASSNPERWLPAAIRSSIRSPPLKIQQRPCISAIPGEKIEASTRGGRGRGARGRGRRQRIAGGARRLRQRGAGGVWWKQSSGRHRGAPRKMKRD